MERLVRQDAQRELRPEIFARITVTVVFNKLGYDAQCEIAGSMIAKECAALSARGFAITPEQQVSGIVIQRGYHERLGARPMRDATELLIRNALARELLRGGAGAGRLVPNSSRWMEDLKKLHGFGLLIRVKQLSESHYLEVFKRTPSPEFPRVPR